MTLQLQSCGEAWQAVLKPPWKLKRVGTRKVSRLQARAENEGGLRSSLGSSEPTRDGKLSPPKGMPGNFVAAPRFSSLLRLSRGRGRELYMETRDRNFMSISDWVVRRVSDPLVEIDPQTVNEAIVLEKEETNAALIASTVPVSVFGYHPPFLPRRVSKKALILLLLLAFITAVIFALRRNKKGATQLLPGHGRSSANGDARWGEKVGEEISETMQQAEGKVEEVEEEMIITPDVGIEVEQETSRWEGAPASLQDQFASSRPNSNASLEQLVKSSTLSLPRIDPPLASPEKANGFPVPEESSEKTLEDESSLVSDDDAAGAEIASSETDVDAPKIDAEIASSNGGMSTTAAAEAEVADDVELQTESVEVTETPSETEVPVLPEVSSATESVIAEAPPPTETEVPSAAESVTAEAPPPTETEVPSAAEVTAEAPPPADESELESEDELSDSELSSDSEYIYVKESDKFYKVKGQYSPRQPAAVPVKVPSSKEAEEESFVGSEPDSRPSLPVLHSVPESKVKEVKENREAYSEMLKRVVPAASVGAGVAALSTLAGFDGAFTIVGLLATTSFLTGNLIWAGERQQLIDDIRNVKDHKQLANFLKARKIIPGNWG